MTLMEQLYHSALHNHGEACGPDDHFADSLAMRNKNKALLLDHLNPRELGILEKYMDMSRDVEEIVRLDRFSLGFRMGAMLMAEVFTQPLDGNRLPD